MVPNWPPCGLVGPGVCWAAFRDMPSGKRKPSQAIQTLEDPAGVPQGASGSEPDRQGHRASDSGGHSAEGPEACRTVPSPGRTRVTNDHRGEAAEGGKSHNNAASNSKAQLKPPPPVSAPPVTGRGPLSCWVQAADEQGHRQDCGGCSREPVRCGYRALEP
ncbi:uncharacterized protein WM277_027273 [Molossus nigricans]